MYRNDSSAIQYRPVHGDSPLRQVVATHGWLEYRYGPGRTCELVNIWVDAEHRDQGLGSSLVSKAELLARAEGILTVYGFCRPSNPGIRRFYERKGYRVISLPRFYSDEDAIMVHKTL